MEKEEKMLSEFLAALNEHVFVKNTTYVFDDQQETEEVLHPIIEDQEAVIIIKGEWDREDLKGILLNLIYKY